MNKKQFFILLFSILLTIPIGISAQNQKIKLTGKNISLKMAFEQIEKQTGLSVDYDSKIIDIKKLISIPSQSMALQDLMELLLNETQCNYTINKSHIIISHSPQNPKGNNSENNDMLKKITGLVTDEKGEPIIGASVLVKGTNTGTITSVDGTFSLEVQDQSEVIISYIGYKQTTLRINKSNYYKIILIEDSKALDEVVVIGYGTQKKKVLTGATIQVKGSDIQKLNTVSPMNALQGSTPGVSITKTDGQPGNSYKVNIRGLGTIGSSAPLYVVDGMIVDNIDYLSASDIENVDILKDAMGGIYGSRAANGVILITTKQGKIDSKASITYDGSYGWQNLYKKANALNAQEYLSILNEARVNSKLLPLDITGTSTSLKISDNGALVPVVPDAAGILAGTNKGTDWMDLMTNSNAPIQKHSISIVGGGKKSAYSLGLSYISQEGVLGKPVASKYDRYNFRLNNDFDLISNNSFTQLKVGETLTYFYDEKSGIGIDGVYGNNIFDCLETNPFLPLYDESGNYHYAIPWASNQVNPIAKMVYNNGSNILQDHNLVGKVYADIQPIKNLVYHVDFGINMSANSSRYYIPVYDLGPSVVNTHDITFQRVSDGLSWKFENSLSYKTTIDKVHNISAMIGTSAEKGGLSGSYMYGVNIDNIFNGLDYAYLSNCPTIYSDGNTVLKGGPWTPSSLSSYYGRIIYDYNSTYLFTAIARRDGSSKFAEGHRWGTFPSFSAGWVISNENFMKQYKWLDFLKIRASWGQNGNQNIPDFQYLSTISNTNCKYSFGIDKNSTTIGSYPDILPNVNVTWETSEQTNIGLDIYCLSNRVSFTFDVYNKTTKNWLVQAPIQAIYGTGAPYINGGDVNNKGIEISLGWKAHISDFKYGISTNYAYNKNKVLRIANESGIIDGPSNVFRTSDEWFRAQVGYPIGYFYGYKTNGIFQNENEVKTYVDKNGSQIMPNAQPGDVRFVDFNGDGKIDGNDRTMIGDAHPAFTYGINLMFEYKSFDLSVLGYGVGGNKIAQATTFLNKNDLNGNYTTDILGRWYGEGTSNFLPRVVYGNSINTDYFSEIYLRKGDYFRISNITMGYDFKKILKKHLPLEQVRLYVAVQNLYTFTKYTGMDPEVGYSPSGGSWGDGVVQGIDLGSYPSPRTVLVGTTIRY